MPTVLEIIKKTTDFLASKGVENARLNAEHLVGHGLGLQRMQLYLQFERSLSEPELENIRPLVRRRAQREPLQYIVGDTDFTTLKLKTDRRALIPRPETEYLVELLLTRLNEPPARILDLGTGTGAIALALAKQFPDVAVTGVDISTDALGLANENAKANGLENRIRWLQSDWYSSVPAQERFELIVANPPYLTAAETAEASPEVRDFEPLGALTSKGEEGLADLTAIVLGAPKFLTPGGLLAMETGIAQHAALSAMVRQAGLVDGESIQDLTGRDRFFLCRAPA